MVHNCKGFNEVICHYLNTWTKECDILFLQEHWIMHNNLHTLQDINQDFHVFAKSDINEQELLMCRPCLVVGKFYYEKSTKHYTHIHMIG